MPLVGWIAIVVCALAFATSAYGVFKLLPSIGLSTLGRAISVMAVSVALAGIAAMVSAPVDPPALAEELNVSAPPPPRSPVMEGLPSVEMLAEGSGHWDPSTLVRKRIGHLIVMCGPERFRKLESTAIKITAECHRRDGWEAC